MNRSLATKQARSSHHYPVSNDRQYDHREHRHRPARATPEPTLESVCEQLNTLTDRVSELEAEVERKDERIEDLYDGEQREYVRKVDVDEDVKETRLQGLKDRLVATQSDDTEELRREIDDLEDRIDELTSFHSGQELA